MADLTRTPAKAGVQMTCTGNEERSWTPAFAGVREASHGCWTPAFAGVREASHGCWTPAFAGVREVRHG